MLTFFSLAGLGVLPRHHANIMFKFVFYILTIGFFEAEKKDALKM